MSLCGALGGAGAFVSCQVSALRGRPVNCRLAVETMPRQREMEADALAAPHTPGTKRERERMERKR